MIVYLLVGAVGLWALHDFAQWWKHRAQRRLANFNARRETGEAKLSAAVAAEAEETTRETAGLARRSLRFALIVTPLALVAVLLFQHLTQG